MAKLIGSYRGYKINENTKNDYPSTYKYKVTHKRFSEVEPIWECDSIEECKQWIESDIEDNKEDI